MTNGGTAKGTRQVETPLDAEQFVEHVGFAARMTDSRRPGPSLYIAVFGRRDAVMPRSVQKNPETSLTWTVKDDVLSRTRVLRSERGRATVEGASGQVPTSALPSKPAANADCPLSRRLGEAVEAYETSNT